MACGSSGDGGDGGGNDDVLMVGARSGGSSGTDACGGGGNGGWTPSPTFSEQPLEREETPFFSQMMARVCGRIPFPSYRAQGGLRGERAHLRPMTLNLTKEGPLKHLRADKVQYKERRIDLRARAQGGARRGPQAV